MIITGTGHCGTAWAADVMTRAGYRTGHESIYDFNDSIVDPDSEERQRNLWRIYDAESSLAAPAYDLRGHRVLHLIRDPLDFAVSLDSRGFWRDTCDCDICEGVPGAHLQAPYAQFIRRHEPAIYTGGDNGTRLANHWFLWNRKIVDNVPASWRLTVWAEQLWLDPIVAAAAFTWLTGSTRITPELVETVGRTNPHNNGHRMRRHDYEAVLFRSNALRSIGIVWVNDSVRNLSWLLEPHVT